MCLATTGGVSMQGRDQSFRQDCPGGHPGMSTEAVTDVQRQLESLIQA